MAFGEIYHVNTSAYTDLITFINACLADCGWTQVGATGIYKSPQADANGNYAYVYLFDSGTHLGVEVSSRLKPDESDLVGEFTRYTDYGVSNWMCQVYPLWFHCYGLDNLTGGSDNNDSYIGGGLYRPYSYGWGRFAPFYAAGTGTSGADECGFQEESQGPNFGCGTFAPTHRAKYASRGDPWMLRTASTYNFPKDMGEVAGGIVISPVFMKGADLGYGFMGTHYNALFVAHYYDGSTSTDLLAGPGQHITVGGTKYFVPPRVYLYRSPYGISVLQAPGTFV